MDIVIEQLRLYAALNGKYICGDNSIDETVYIPVNIAIEIVKLCGIRDSYRFLRK